MQGILAQNQFSGDLRDHVQALDPAWQAVFEQEPVHRALLQVNRFLQQQLALGAQIFPARPLRALHEVVPAEVKVVILGQDPYHGPGQAQGLAFSVPDECRTPPSLRNIFAELAQEYPDRFRPQRNSLSRWARQGALLLNSALSVQAHQPASHARIGWSIITDALLVRVLQEPQPKVFLLWGRHAQACEPLLARHGTHGPVLVLKANHPSPLSATRPPVPFMGCGHFARANEWLASHGQLPMDWVGGQ